MPKQVIYTPKAPEPGPYSQAIRSGNLIFVAGQTAEDPITNKPVRGSVAEQTRLILNNIQTILNAAGSDLNHVVRADVFISSMDIKDQMNGVYREFFKENMPARNCVAVAGIDDGLDVEIEVIAAMD